MGRSGARKMAGGSGVSGGLACREHADPLRLAAKPKARQALARQRAALQRGHSLEWLYNAKRINQGQYAAACKIRGLCAQVEGQTGSVDLGAARVDCSVRARDWLMLGTCEAREVLQRIGARLGPDQAYAVFAIAGRGISVQETALAFEEDDAKRAAGKPSRATRDYVGRLMRDGLAHAAFELGLAVEAGPTHKRIFAMEW